MHTLNSTKNVVFCFVLNKPFSRIVEKLNIFMQDVVEEDFGIFIIQMKMHVKFSFKSLRHKMRARYI